MLIRFLLSSALILAAFSNPAFAQDPPQDGEPNYAQLSQLEGATEEARVHFTLANRYHETGRFSAAAQEFRASFALCNRSELLYNAYLAHREAGEYDDAIEAIESFIEANEDEELRVDAVARLEQTRALRDQLRAEEADSDQAQAPSPAEVAEVEVEVGVETETDAEPDETAPSQGRPIAPWIVAGTGAAIALASVVPGVLALSDNSELDSLCETSPCTGDAAAIQTRGQRRATISDIMLFGGLAIAAGGVIWGLLSPAPDDDSRARANAMCEPSSCHVSLLGAF